MCKGVGLEGSVGPALLQSISQVMLKHLGFVLKARERFYTGSDMIRFAKDKEGAAVWNDTGRMIKLEDSLSHPGHGRCGLSKGGGHGVKAGGRRGQRIKGEKLQSWCLI